MCRAEVGMRTRATTLFLEPTVHSPEQAGHPSHRFDHLHFLDHGCLFELHHCLHAPETVTGAVVGTLGATIVICAVVAVGASVDVLLAARKPAAHGDSKGERICGELMQAGYKSRTNGFKPP